ncbi:cell wall / vacuolar inhibitor of fructosidase 2-like [Chenopodium quinoa]|nr:cell wall / vacuolar inhibitor of fructosidase 2-like [Chenopodium quinoa]
MGKYSKILSLILFLFINNTIKVVQGDEDFIQKTCKNTQYIDLCISSLKSNPSSSNSDLKGLATIMVNIGIANASDTYAYLSSQHSQVPKSSGTSDTNMKNVYKLCASKYTYANDSLKSTLQDLSMENYDYASMHVMAASDYPNACHNAFKRYRDMDYPTVLKVREDGFKHICAVVLGIVDQLYSIDNHF